MRANFVEFRQNSIVRYFEESEFCQYSHIIEISCKRAKFCMPFCSTENEISLKISFGYISKISHEISFRKAKFRATSEISWNMSSVGVEIKLNLNEINKS